MVLADIASRGLIPQQGLPPIGCPVQIWCMAGFAAMVEVVGISGQSVAVGAGGL